MLFLKSSTSPKFYSFMDILKALALWMCLSLFSLFFFQNAFFFSICTSWHEESQFLDQRLNLCPLQWKPRVLTNEPPGKSLCFFVQARWASQFHFVKLKFRDATSRSFQYVLFCVVKYYFTSLHKSLYLQDLSLKYNCKNLFHY